MGPAAPSARVIQSPFVHHGLRADVTRGNMILLWTCLLTAAAAHRVTESAEDITHPVTNTTTLYPVPTNGTDKPKISSSATWKIETTFSKGNFTDSNSTESKEVVVERPSNASKEFKPSPHLGSYLEVETPEIGPTREPFGFSSVIKKPPVGFFGSHKPDKTPFKFPKEVLKNYQEFPYKFEKAIYTRAKKPTEDPWRPTGGMEPTPTDEAPTRLPAGGLYQLPDAFKENAFKEKPRFGDEFKEKPSFGDDDNFGLEFSDAKDHSLKKRPNPWKKLLHFITALIPVGIIFSALTPNVITIESTGSGLGSQRPYRHIDVTSAPHIPPAAPNPPNLVSERCRRRLLCELHADYNYNPHPGSRRGRCRRLRCEDPQALADTLDFLLSYHRAKGNPPGQGTPEF